jgi:predicted dehydrogenase
MKTTRVGIIGVGSIALAAHLPSYAARQDVEVVAFADPEVERVSTAAAAFAKETGRPRPCVYGSAEEMLASESLDAVSICTPNTSHVHLALKALDAGVHVLLEKSMATQLDQAQALVDKVTESGKVLMVGMSHRYRDDVAVMKRYVEAGDLGQVYYAKTRILRRRGTPKGWFTDKAVSGGGPLLDIGVHALDVTWWLMGKPEVKSVSGFLYQGIGNDKLDFIQTWKAKAQGNENNEIYTTEDFASAFIRFANGSVLQLEVSWAINGPEDDALQVDLFGAQGGMSLHPLRFYSTAHGVLTSTTPSVGMGPLYQREIDHFLECVHTGTTPCSDVAQGRDVVHMLVAIAASSEQGREITF